MSYLAVSQLGLEEIDWGLRIKRSCSIQAIRLKIYEHGTIADGVFTLSLVCNGGSVNNEAILNRLQSLEEAILNQPIILVADDNEIARSASRGTMNGIVIGASR